MKSLNPNDPLVLETQNKLKITLPLIRLGYKWYSERYNTDDFPPVIFKIYKVDINNNLSRLLSPFLYKGNVEKLKSYFGINFTKENINSIALLYSKYRGKLESISPLLDTKDLDAFSKWLVEENTSRAVLETGLNIDSKNELKLDVESYISNYANNPNKDISGSAKEIALKFAIGIQTTYLKSNINTIEGINKVRNAERNLNIQILDSNNMPKIYNSIDGLYIFDINGRKVSLFPNSSVLMNPIVQNDLFGTIVAEFIKGENNGNIIVFFNKYIAVDLSEEVQKQLDYIKERIEQDILKENPNINGTDFSSELERRLSGNNTYSNLIRRYSLLSNFNSTPALKSRLSNLFIARVKDMGIVVDEYMNFQNEYGVDTETEDQIELGTIVAGDQFDFRGDEVNPTTLVASSVKKLFLAIPKVDVGTNTILPSPYIKGVYQYEKPEVIETLVRMELANITKPTTSNYDGVYTGKDIIPTFDLMYQKLIHKIKTNKDNRLAQVVANMEMIINNPNATNTEIDDFKKDFVSSFSLVSQDYLMSMVNEETITSTVENTTSAVMSGKRETDRAYSNKSLKLTINNYENLANTHAAVITELIGGINTKHISTRNNRVDSIDLKPLDALAKIIVKSKGDKFNPILDRQEFKDIFKSYFNVELNDYEVTRMLDSKVEKQPSKNLLYYRDQKGKSSQISVSTVIRDFYTTREPARLKSITEDIVFKNLTDNIFKEIVDVLNETRKPKQSNVYVIGSKSYYGFAEHSSITMTLQSLKDGDMTELDKFEGTSNGVAYYLKGSEYEEADKTNISKESGPTSRVRIREIKIQDNTATKVKDGVATAVKDNDMVDNLITSMMKFTNPNSSYYRNSQSTKAVYPRIFDFAIAADGSSSITFTGIGSNNGLLTLAPYVEADLVNGTIVMDKIRMGRFKKLKLQSILQNINNDTKLLSEYVGIQSLDISEVDALLREQLPSMSFEGKDLKFKRDFLSRKYLSDNLIEGYHYKPHKGQDLSKLGTILDYENFEKGSYHLGEMFNDIFNDMRAADAIVPTYMVMKYKDKYNTDVPFPMLHNHTFNDMVTMVRDVDITELFPEASATETMKVMDSLLDSRIVELLDKQYKRLSEIPAWSSSNGEVHYLNEVPLDTITKIAKSSKADRALLLEAAWKNYIMSSTIYMSEFSDFFTGSVAKYKTKGNKLNIAEFNKRAPFAMKATKRNVHQFEDSIRRLVTLSGEEIDFDMNMFTSVAIFEDIEDVTSRYIKDIMKAAPRLNSYLMNVADGQSIAGPEYHKYWMMTTKNSWTSEDEKMHRELLDRDIVLTKEHLDWLVKTGNFSSGGVDKMFAFGINDLKRVFKKGSEGAFSGNNPINLKTSIFFAYPAVIRGTGMEKLLDAMEKQGVNILAARSAVKTTAPLSTTIHNVEKVDGYDSFTSLKDFNPNPLEDTPGTFRLNPFLMDAHNFGQQQDVPNKGVYEGEAGKQLLKNILANLDVVSDEKDYFVESLNKSFSGREILKLISDTGRNIIQSQQTKYYNETINEDGSIDSKKLRKLLIAQLDPIKDIEEIEILKDPDIPLTTLLNSTQKLFPVLSKYHDKKVSQINTNKASAVQVANIGITEYYGKEKNDILYLTEDKELTPPKPIRFNDLKEEVRKVILKSCEKSITDTPLKDKIERAIVYYDTEGNPTLNRYNVDGSKNRMRIAKAKVLMPFKQLNLDMSQEDFVNLYHNGKIDKRIFENILSYRIPNKAIFCNDSIEIVGILPSTMGDVAIVYHEMTTKSASSFSFDNLYFMMPSYNVKKKILLDNQIQDLINNLTKEGIEIKTPISKYTITGSNAITELLKDAQINKLFRGKGYLDNKGKFNNESPVKFIIENSELILDNLSYPVHTVDIEGETVYLDEIVVSFVDSNIEFINELKEQRDAAQDRNKVLLNDAYEKYGKDTVVAIEYAEEGYKGDQNKIIEYYNAILESEKTYPDLITPSDSDAVVGANYYKDEIINNVLFKKYYVKKTGELPNKLSKEQYKEEFDKYIKETDISVMEGYSPIERAFMRDDMLKAKNLVAIMANHMSDIAYTQIFNQSIKHSFLDFRNEYSKEELASLGSLAVTVGLDPITNKAITARNTLKQTMLVSWLMNTAVDAANDNYIISGNFNSYTAPVAMLLTRMGLSPNQVFSIIASDVVKEITAANSRGFSKVSDMINTEYSKQALADAASDLHTAMKQADAKFLDVFNEENMYFPDKEVLPGFTMKQAIMGLWGIVHPIGKAHSATITYGKPSSNGSGVNIGKHIALMNNSKVVQAEDAFNGTAEKLAGFGTGKSSTELYQQLDQFHTEIPENYTIEGATRNGGLLLTNKIASELFLEMSSGYINLVNDVSTVLGDMHSTNEERLNLISNSIYTYLVGKVINPLRYYTGVTESNEGMQALKEYLFDKIVDKKKTYANRGLTFFKDIQYNKTTHTLFFPGKMNMSSETEKAYRAELSQLEEHDQSLMTDIAIYTLLESGFKPSISSLYSFIPTATVNRMGIGRRLENVRQAWSSGDYTTGFDVGGSTMNISLDEIVKTIILQNPTDYHFSKRIYPSALKDASTIKTMNLNNNGKYIISGSPTLNLKEGKDVLIPLTKKNTGNFLKDGSFAPALNIVMDKKQYVGYFVKFISKEESVSGESQYAVYNFEPINKTNTTKVKFSIFKNEFIYDNNLADMKGKGFKSLYTTLLNTVPSKTIPYNSLCLQENHKTVLIEKISKEECSETFEKTLAMLRVIFLLWNKRF